MEMLISSGTNDFIVFKRILKILKAKNYILYAVAMMAAMMTSSCADETLIDGVPGGNSGNDYKGEMVLFKVGTTDNTTSSRAASGDAKTYYMPDGSHFVCRMYYKAQAGADTLDINGGSAQTAWLKVKGTIGNSLYWNKAYADVDENTKGVGGVDDYGNDYSAPAFYWQNRKGHAFLAWTDLNHASDIIGGETQGQLKFGKDEIYKIYTGETTVKWTTKNYEVYGIPQPFSSLDEIQNYMQSKVDDTTFGETDDFKAKQAEISFQHDYTAQGVTYYYQHGWQYKYSETYATTTYNDADPDKATSREFGWTQYQMFFDKLPFNGTIPADADKVYDLEDTEQTIVKFLKDHATGDFIAAAEVITDADGNYLDKDGNKTTNKAEYTYNYYLTDEYGNIKYDETKPKYVFYYKVVSDKENVKEVEEYPVLAFDLKRGDKTSMSQQPDIVQAVEIQSPNGATQESNRVNLYFKHQFSQIQVNIKNSADNSVTIDAGDIQRVELLGVTEKGYVHTELNKDGKVKAATYQDIDFSNYTEQDLKDNQFGTSFQMFDLPEAETAYGYLKSFNAIAYGQLQAIRITWKEKNTEYTHAATYRIPNTELMNLRSGVRYVWNIEIRRGTLAIIRTEIVDWELPTDEQHNGTADGTIQD